VRRALLVLAGACGGKHPAPPVVIANAAPLPDAAEPDAADEARCESPAELPIDAGGKTGTVSLVVCTTRDVSSSDKARDEGFVEHERAARLTFIGKQRTATEIHTWTDGWEWGTSVDLAGVLESTSGDGVAVLRFASNAAAPSIGAYSTRVVAYRLESDGWRPLDVTSAATLEIRFAPDRKSMTIDGCDEDTGSAAPGCGGYTDAKQTATLVVTYDGARLDIQ
jgi:hypothetical protein